MALEHVQPIATASMPWQIVLAIIAFNVIGGIMSKRKRRPPKADPLPGSQGDPKGDAWRRMEEARARSAAEAERKAAERLADRDRDEGRGTVRARAEGEGMPGSGEDAGGAAMGRDAGAKAKEVGKDLLGQLARELGLELPPAPKPSPSARPGPSASPGRPAPVSRNASAPAKVRPTAAQYRSSTPVPGGPAAARKTAVREEEGSDSPVPAPAPGAHLEPVRSAASPTPVLDLGDPEALRKAFILKTILDKPHALRARP
jgi:hypothetical protein